VTSNPDSDGAAADYEELLAVRPPYIGLSQDPDLVRSNGLLCRVPVTLLNVGRRPRAIESLQAELMAVGGGSVKCLHWGRRWPLDNELSTAAQLETRSRLFSSGQDEPRGTRRAVFDPIVLTAYATQSWIFEFEAIVPLGRSDLGLHRLVLLARLTGDRSGSPRRSLSGIDLALTLEVVEELAVGVVAVPTEWTCEWEA
jgi:hypothetical protein